MADVMTAPDGPVAGVNYVAADTELKAGAIGFWGGMVQAVTHIAPGLNILLGLTFIVSFAGIGAPIAYIIGGIICLGVAVVLTQLAKNFTGAGGYFLYVSSTIGPRTGWLTTWLYFLYDPVGVSSVLAFTALLVDQTVNAQYHLHIIWYVWFFAFLAVVTAFTLFGISLSARAMLILGGLEILIFLILALSGLASPGPGGFNANSFNPGNLPSAKGLYLGVVFTILALSGFEAVAPLAEETENPRRNLPIAIVLSTIGVAAFYAFVNWGVLVGHGTNGVSAGNFTQSSQIFELAKRLWSGAWVAVLIATVNSALAVSIAIQNATTRVFFGMGRIGALPRWLGKAHPRWKTPSNAILAMTVLTVVIAMVLGSTMGPVNQFGMIGIVQTLGLIVVYSMGNIGALWYYRRKRRTEFNWLLHGLIPVATSAALVWVGWKTVQGLHIFGLPTPLDFAPWIAIAWLVAGLLILFFLSRTGREEWLFKAGQSTMERPETAAEAAHRPAI
ncbi:MAG: APC family permease [Solirubrobacterales bacterium]|nr:APC family permease [Solirubrobacterales bacterium]MBV8941315.1 APC family permease [Solirubrobacterales bacterium]MBV9166759.1 APC family permease [Solirubrobacterales bacterium]MBV9535596.1 APC family permease [Solirubrobacterales bacterium]